MKDLYQKGRSEPNTEGKSLGQMRQCKQNAYYGVTECTGPSRVPSTSTITKNSLLMDKHIRLWTDGQGVTSNGKTHPVYGSRDN